MCKFGESLFGGSRFIRWSLTPALLLFAVAVPLAIPHWTPMRVAIMAGLELMCLGLLAVFWLPAKFGALAFRGLTGLVFLAYAAYLIEELFFSNKPLSLFSGRGASSPINSILGFIFIGLPCMTYALFGRFSLRKPPTIANDHEVDEESESET